MHTGKLWACRAWFSALALMSFREGELASWEGMKASVAAKISSDA